MKESNIAGIGNDIYFTAEINDENIFSLMNSVTTRIRNANSKDPDEDFKTVGFYTPSERVKRAPEITLFIQSNGGSVVSCLKFIDFIEIAQKQGKISKLITVITGVACSAATLLAIVGNEKYITENALAMLHGFSTTEAKYVGALELLRNRVVEIFVKHTHKSADEINKYFLKENWFIGSQYVDSGFADGIFKGGKKEKREENISIRYIYS